MLVEHEDQLHNIADNCGEKHDFEIFWRFLSYTRLITKKHWISVQKTNAIFTSSRCFQHPGLFEGHEVERSWDEFMITDNLFVLFLKFCFLFIPVLDLQSTLSDFNLVTQYTLSFHNSIDKVIKPDSPISIDNTMIP